MYEATCTTHNGHTCTYDNPEIEDRSTLLVEPLVVSPLRAEAEPAAATTAAEPAATQQVQPSTHAASKTQSVGEKPNTQARHAAGQKKKAHKTKSTRPKIKYVPQAELDAELASLEELSWAVRTGDKAALDKLRHALDEGNPYIWRRLADLQLLIEERVIALIADSDPLRLEAFRKRCSELRHDLLEDEPSSLATKMAASRVVAGWCFAQLLELRALKSSDKRLPMKDLAQAERRYQMAMRTFGEARKLDVQLQRLGQTKQPGR